MKSDEINSVITKAVEFAKWTGDYCESDSIQHRQLKSFFEEYIILVQMGGLPWISGVTAVADNSVQITYAWDEGKWSETFTIEYSPEEEHYIKSDMVEIAKLWLDRMLIFNWPDFGPPVSPRCFARFENHRETFMKHILKFKEK